MRWFRNRSTSTKLILAFFGMAILVGIVGYLGVRGMGAISESQTTMYEKHALGIDHLQEAHLQVLKMSRGVRNAIIDGVFKDPRSLEQRIENWQKSKDLFAKGMEEFKARIVLAEVRTATAELEKTFQEVAEAQRHIMQLARENKLDEAHARIDAAVQLVNHLDEQIEKVVGMKRAVMKKADDEGDALYASMRLFILAMVGVAIALALGIGAVIARLIARPLGQAVEVLDHVAQGDFTRTLAVDTEDEVGRMARALNQAVASMRGALHEVSAAAGHAASASQQLSAASGQLSSGAQEQASSLEETAASLEEITGTVKQNADNARQANQLAAGARDTAEKGGQVVAGAVSAMGEINQASKRIAAIITTIDEIAFQTNLLALNAAVEAARAGEQGRGFAVVAAEVRNLAQRSAEAAKEIKGLIQDSVAKVQTGSDLVSRSGATLEEIVGAVKKVTDVIAEIAAAASEQTAGIDQVNRAVAQMDQVVQSNAAQTEELSSTAQTLAGQAEELQALVARFTLGDGVRAAAAARAARPASPAPRAPLARPAKAPVSVALATAVPGTNGSAQAKHDGFEEF